VERAQLDMHEATMLRELKFTTIATDEREALKAQCDALDDELATVTAANEVTSVGECA
jgi:hypothetical protein